jgi:hypothetical protein
MKTLLVMLIALFAVSAALLLPGARTPVAEAAPDFCGTAEVDVPDTGPSFDFTTPCMHHDQCYGANHGTNEVIRKSCDDTFLAEMTKYCKDHWRWWQGQYYDCLGTAAIYYAGVRVGGWLYFYG